ncbi:DedA family protein [Rhizomonospora bruguierae]|uniref:DedA family protein n=1 Tax=Rhizomonospora bruguierae TaxID=1581705 RepID=UPI001BCD01CE|nr:VTT domain-containing protein [Micromonospora sp. NBRC 107566]
MITGVAEPVLRTLAELDPPVLAAAAGGMAALEATALLGLVLPGDLVVLLAATTAATTGGRHLALVLLAAAVGTWLGELGGYAIGRAAGERLRTGRLGRRVGDRHWATAERYLHGRGARALVPARFVAVVHAVAPLVAGTVRMPARRFALWSGVGAAVWACCYTAAGAAAGQAYRQYGDLGLVTSAGVLAATAAALAVRRRRRLTRRPARPPRSALPPPARRAGRR